MANRIPRPPAIEIQAFLDNGWFLDDICEACGASKTTVKRWMVFYKIKGVRGGRLTAPPVEEIDRLIEIGMSSEQLSTHYAVHLVTITNWLRYYGLLAKRARARAKKKKIEKVESKDFKYNAPVVTSNPPQFIIN